MTVPQVKTLSSRRLYKAYKESRLGIDGFAHRVRDFHPELAQTTVKQLTRWHAGQRPRNPEIVVAAYAEISDRDEAFFYTSADEDEEESRMRRMLEIAGELRRNGMEALAADLQALAATSEPMSREQTA